jgi:hypothetical protein
MRGRSECRSEAERNGRGDPVGSTGGQGAPRRGVGRASRRALALSIPLVLLAATSAHADLVRYAWSGYVEATPASGNPWGLQGDGAAATNSDGTPFTLVVHVDPAAIDTDGALNPDLATFAPESATLTIGGHTAILTSPQLRFSDDSFSGLFDAVRFQANAQLFGATLSFAADVRIPASSFALANPAAPDLPPRFADTLPIQFGGSGSSALTTFPRNLAVSAQLETCAGPESVVWSAPGLGVADGITVTVTNLGAPDLDTFPLRGPDFAAAQQCTNARSLTHATGSDWGVTLSAPTHALLVYAKFWRGPGAGASAVTYQFDAPFTILSGLTGAVVSHGNTRLVLPATSFHDGILQFEGPIASLSADVDSTTGAEQATTFAVVPEPNVAAGLAIATGGLVLLGRGRVGRPGSRPGEGERGAAHAS